MAPKTVTIFGVFDGLHDGHREFIHEAKKQGKKLVVIVAPDKIVNELKGETPIYNEVERINMLLNIKEINVVFLGDPEQDTYNILKRIKPDIIFLGYDQKALHDSIKKKIRDKTLPKMKLIFGKSHKPEKFKSSILNK